MRHASRSLARRSPHFLLAALSAAVMTACGGGGDATTTDTGTGTGGTGTGGGGVTPAALTVSGVAARGAALAGATVQASCATGSGSATALADGSYSLAITGGVLPCVLKATSSDATTTFYSLAAGTGATATANITPLTELVIAQMTGQEPAAFYASASTDATALTTAVTAEKIDAASTAVVATLQAAGVDTSSITSIVSGSLSAGTGAGYDGVLDTLGTTLTSTGTTLGDLVTTVATTSAATSSTGTTTTSGSEATAGSMLPAALLLKAKAPTCGALRSTTYRLVIVKPSASTGATDPVTTTGTATLDAANANGPTLTYEDGSSEALTPVDGESCHFTLVGNDGGTADLVVAPSGVVVARSSATWTAGETVRDPNFRMIIALPVQNLAVSDLAGSWNGLGWEAITGGAQVDPGIATVAADGSISFKCTDNNPATAETACTTDGPYTGLTANADGGFDLTINDPAGTSTLRAFAYRAGNGNTVVVALHASGTVQILTPYRTLTAPAIGDAHKSWNIAMNSGWVAGDALQYNSFAITGVDAAAGTFTRNVTSVATGVTHAQTLALNGARNGWMHRAAGTAAGSDGSTVTVREMYTLKLGIGISAYWLPASNQAGTNARFALSVTQP